LAKAASVYICIYIYIYIYLERERERERERGRERGREEEASRTNVRTSDFVIAEAVGEAASSSLSRLDDSTNVQQESWRNASQESEDGVQPTIDQTQQTTSGTARAPPPTPAYENPYLGSGFIRQPLPPPRPRFPFHPLRPHDTIVLATSPHAFTTPVRLFRSFEESRFPDRREPRWVSRYRGGPTTFEVPCPQKPPPRELSKIFIYLRPLRCTQHFAKYAPSALLRSRGVFSRLSEQRRQSASLSPPPSPPRPSPPEPPSPSPPPPIRHSDANYKGWKLHSLNSLAPDIEARFSSDLYFQAPYAFALPFYPLCLFQAEISLVALVGTRSLYSNKRPIQTNLILDVILDK
jgi:hypothetical protein